MNSQAQLSALSRQFKALAAKKRKDFDDEKILMMARELQKEIPDVPVNRVEELFKAVYRSTRYFPEDKDFITTWGEIKSRDGAKNGEYGYFDFWGTWIPNGTYYTALSIPTCEWLMLASEEEKKLKIKWSLDKLTEDEKGEFYRLRKKKFYPKKGKHQKARKDWGVEEEQYYEKLMDRYDMASSRFKELEKDVREEIKERESQNVG